MVQALTTLFARITKFGWFDTEKEEFVFRNVIGDVSNFLQVCNRNISFCGYKTALNELFIFLQGSVEHCTIGVQLLSVLTSEMNQVSEADANRSLTKHRKIASSFRDQQLFEIFRLCCTLLKSALGKTLNFDDGLQVRLFSIPTVYF